MKAISSEKVCFIIVKTREFDAKVAPVIDDPGDNPADDNGVEVLADYPDDPVYEELTSFLDSLSEDELIELHALVMLGRGDVDLDGWDEAMQTAADDLDENIAHHLLEIPLISDYLAEGLSQFGQSCAD
ncbi:MAG: DUF3775 domain-containing protein [Rhodospirillales bacterium]|nr:DUF3775 domain-containing protein [Rhodospirillales bacterium]